MRQKCQQVVHMSDKMDDEEKHSSRKRRRKFCRIRGENGQNVRETQLGIEQEYLSNHLPNNGLKLNQDMH